MQNQELCVLTPGVSGADFTFAYICRPISTCNSDGGVAHSGYCPGYRSGEKYDIEGLVGVDGRDIKCCTEPYSVPNTFPETAEATPWFSEQECFANPLSIFVDWERPPSKEFLREFFEAYKRFNESWGASIVDYEGEGLVDCIIDYALDCEKYPEYCGIDPLFLMAIFRKESNFGRTEPGRPIQRAVRNKSVGNIKYPVGNPEFCTAEPGNADGYCAYARWCDGVRHFYWLIKNKEKYVAGGNTTLSAIIENYAPREENDTDEYILLTKSWLCHWRGLYAKYRWLQAISERRVT
jgi:hypothetical protein